MHRSTPDSAVAARTGLVRRLRDSLEGYAFIAPATLLIGLFGLFPIFFTLYISLFQWRIRRGRFLGLSNYVQLFGSAWYLIAIILAALVLYAGARLLRRRGWPALRVGGALLFVAGVAAVVVLVAQVYVRGDRDMLDSLRVTVWYSLGSVPIQLVGGLVLAVLLNRKFRGRQGYRVLFLLPYIVPSVASAAVFERIFSLRGSSLANSIVTAFGGKPLQWLYEPAGIFHLLFGIGSAPVANAPDGGSAGLTAIVPYLQTWIQGPSLALVSVMIFNWWVFIGYYALIFLNGLSQIPREVYDAAEVDGAGALTVLRTITVPLLSPSTYFLSLIGIIGTFKAFTNIYILRTSAALGTIDPMSVHIFFTFFRESRFGYAAAMSLVLFAIVLMLTLVERRLVERRVFYGE